MPTKPRQLYHIFTRDITLATADVLHRILTRELKALFGVGMHNQVQYFNGKTVSIFRDITENLRLGSIVASKPVSYRAFSPAAEQRFRKDINELRRLLARARKSSPNVQRGILPVTARLLISTWPWGMTANMLPSAWKDQFLQKHPDDGLTIIDRMYQLRVFSEGWVEETDVFWMQFLGSIFKQHGYPMELRRVVRLRELLSIADGKPLPRVATLRKRYRGYIHYHGKLFLTHDLPGFLKKHRLHVDLPNVNTDVQEIRGMSANPAKALRAKVQLIRNRDDIPDFHAGNVLVTSMTSPDFVPAMKKASAIVTDEGGVTCHAAIVSRELGKPCIIGTKIATQVLKDGDMVEVDANKGIVKKV